MSYKYVINKVCDLVGNPRIFSKETNSFKTPGLIYNRLIKHVVIFLQSFCCLYRTELVAYSYRAVHLSYANWITNLLSAWYLVIVRHTPQCIVSISQHRFGWVFAIQSWIWLLLTVLPVPR